MTATARQGEDSRPPPPCMAYFLVGFAGPTPDPRRTGFAGPTPDPRRTGFAGPIPDPRRTGLTAVLGPPRRIGLSFMEATPSRRPRKPPRLGIPARAGKLSPRSRFKSSAGAGPSSRLDPVRLRVQPNFQHRDSERLAHAIVEPDAARHAIVADGILEMCRHHMHPVVRRSDGRHHDAIDVRAARVGNKLDRSGCLGLAPTPRKEKALEVALGAFPNRDRH